MVILIWNKTLPWFTIKQKNGNVIIGGVPVLPNGLYDVAH